MTPELSPVNVVARVLASHRSSVSRISSATAMAGLATSSATWVRLLGVLIGDHRETAPMIAGLRGFDRGVCCKEAPPKWHGP